MTIALVGSEGAVATGANSATPAWGAGASRTAGNLLICQWASDGVATIPATPSGWSIAKSQAGTSCASGIFYKIAAGADTAPVVSVTTTLLAARLLEFSGADGLAPLDKSGGLASTTSPSAATAASADANPGSLVISSFAALYSQAATKTNDYTLNNGATDVEVDDDATSRTTHYVFSRGVTTGNSAATSASMSFTTTMITGSANAMATFKPSLLPNIIGSAAGSGGSTGVLQTPNLQATFGSGFEMGAKPNGTVISGTGSIIAAAARNGGFGLRVTPAVGSSAYLNTSNPQGTSIGGTKDVGRIAFRVNTFPNGGTNTPPAADILRVTNTGSSDYTADFYFDANGLLGVQCGLSGALVNGPTITDNNWHVLEWQCDCGGTTWTCDWKVDGVQYSRASSVSSKVPQTHNTILIGKPIVGGNYAAYSIDYDDYIHGIWGLASTDWFGDGRVIGYMGGVDGVHSFTTGDFSVGDAGTTQAPTYSNFWQGVDPTPPWSTTRDAVNNIAQRVIRTTGYVEIFPVQPTETGRARLVMATVGFSSSTTSNTAGCIVRNSDGVATVLVGDLPVAQGGNGGALANYGITTMGYGSALVPVPANGWTATEVGLVRLRFGGSNDVTPPPTIGQMMIEVDWPPLTPNATGSANGVGAATGVLSTPVPLSGSTAGVGATSGQPTVLQKLSGVAAGAGATTGVITIPALLVGTTSGSGTTTGALRTQPQLAGSAAATGATTGTIKTQPQLAGTAASSGATVGALTATSKLSGSTAGAGNTTGALTTFANIVGSTAGIGALVGQPTTPTAVTADLSGTSSGTSTATGALTVTISLSGTTSGSGATTGALAASPRLSGASAATGATTGALAAQPKLSGSSAGLGATVGAPTASPKLSGSSAGLGATAGALTVTVLLIGTSTGIGVATAVLTVPGLAVLSGAAAGSGTTTGTLLTTPALAGSAVGAGTTVGALSATAQLSGVTNAIGTTSGALTASPKLSGSSTGLGTTAGALITTPALLGSSNGVGATVAVLTVPGLAVIAGTAAGNSTTTGALAATSKLSGSSAGTSTTTGTLLTQPKLSGASAGVGNTTGTLKTQPALGGLAASVGNTTGAINTAIRISGSAIGVGLATGSIRLPIPLSGSATGTGTAVGTLIALAAAKPIYPLNTNGYITTATSGFIDTAGAGGVGQTGASSGRIKEAGAGIIEQAVTGSVS